MMKQGADLACTHAFTIDDVISTPEPPRTGPPVPTLTTISDLIEWTKVQQTAALSCKVGSEQYLKENEGPYFAVVTSCFFSLLLI